MEAFFRSHGLGQHVQANGTTQLRLERFGRDGDLHLLRDGFLGRTVELVQGQVPGFFYRVHFWEKTGGKLRKGSRIIVFFQAQTS